jgi:hypothetical protein
VLFLDFLFWYLEKVYDDNVYSDSWGAERANKDGKAQTAEELYKVLSYIRNSEIGENDG